MHNYSRKEKTSMKLFEMPEIDVVKFTIDDTITTSGLTPPPPGSPSVEEFCI